MLPAGLVLEPSHRTLATENHPQLVLESNGRPLRLRRTSAALVLELSDDVVYRPLMAVLIQMEEGRGLMGRNDSELPPFPMGGCSSASLALNFSTKHQSLIL